jgi:adenylate cyclase
VQRGTWQFPSFRGRLLVFVLVPMLAVLAGVFFSVERSTSANTRTVINDSLLVGRDTLQRLLAERRDTLLAGSALLTADFAFRTAYATENYATRLDTAQNYLRRVGIADAMVIVSPDGFVEVDTLHPGKQGEPFAWPELLDAADQSESYTASSVVLIDDNAYQLSVTPFLAPDLKAWIVVGRRLDDAFVRELKKLVRAEVSIVRQSDRKATVLASSLDAARRAALSRTVLMANAMGEAAGTRLVELEGAAYVTLEEPLLQIEGGGQVATVLQRSLNEALAPYRPLNQRLLLLFVIGVLIAGMIALWLAKNLSQPVAALAKRVERIAGGDYAQVTSSTRRDELGQLAGSVNEMARGLADRERVRDLLGKVVSKEIASELLSGKVELGGEERQVTVLFSDIRNFTTLCEQLPATQIVGLLNRYLSRMSEVIESQGGVVDKYIGDAVMALFGAPVARADAATAAVRAAIAMQEALRELHALHDAEGLPRLATGIGIHTGPVVAGNLGSTHRMNYTVIGDAVNLASRLQGLTREYDSAIIVSAAAAAAAAAPGFAYRPLGEVRVKGKSELITIYGL